MIIQGLESARLNALDLHPVPRNGKPFITNIRFVFLKSTCPWVKLSFEISAPLELCHNGE